MNLVVLSALFYCIAFPKLSVYIISFVCLTPLFIQLQKPLTQKVRFCYGTFWGMAIALGHSYFLFNTITVQYNKPFYIAVFFIIFLIMIPTGLLYGTFAIFLGFLRKDSFITYLFIVPSLWTITEYIKEIIPILVPWGGIGYAIVPFQHYIQMADITGYYGLIFIIALINSAIAYLLKDFKISMDMKIIHQSLTRLLIDLKMKHKKVLIVIAAMLLIPVIYGHFKINEYETETRETKNRKNITVALAQGNFSGQVRWSGSSLFTRLNTYLGLSACPENDKCLIIWPETVLNSSGQLDNALFTHLINRIGRKNTLITGGTRRVTNMRGVFNSAFVIQGSGSITWYDKNILLPYSETIFLRFILGQFYRAPSIFLPGVTDPVLETGFGDTGLSICFEILYPWFIRNSVKKGADFLVNISNDAWFGDTSEPVIHFYGNILRAVENRRYLLRASNSGISAIIDPAGTVIAQSSLFRRETIRGSISPLTEISLYTRFGDWVLYLCLLVLLGNLFYILFKVPENENNNPI